ncbi:MAG TPA: tetratricopeptide repeat protein, partial [Bryobacteraceae bacterium]
MRGTACLLLLACGVVYAQADDPVQLREQAAALVAQGKFGEAEPLLVRALESLEQESGPEALGLTGAIGLLAALYRAEGRNAEAQKLYERSLAIRRKNANSASPDFNPDLIPDLKSLAGLYAAQGKTSEAELSYLRVIAIREQFFGADDLEMAKDCT